MYAIDARFPGQLPARVVAAYREVSRLWHQFLRNDQPDPAAGPAAGRQLPYQPGYQPGHQSGHQSGHQLGQHQHGQQHSQGRKRKAIDLGPSSPTSPRPASPRKSPRTTYLIRPVDIDIDLTIGLRRLFGPTARWLSDEQYIGAVKASRLPPGEALIVVLPTGGGKSALFLLPPLVEPTGTTIVVVPF